LGTEVSKLDAFVKSQKMSFFVIPAKAGIQSKQIVNHAKAWFWTPSRHSAGFSGVTTFYETIKILC